MALDDSLLKVARSWLENQSKLTTIASNMRNSLPKSHEFLEGELIQKMNPTRVSGSFCAIDGGIACEEFHGLDVAAFRSVSACFTYENSKLVKTAYFPSSHPPLEISAHSALGQFEKMRFLSLVRLESELECALNSLNKFSPDFLILDGSIAPLIDDKPPSDSELVSLYDNLISIYKNLYSSCEQKNCSLLGITKDSRGRRFSDILCVADSSSSSVLSACHDTVFLDHLLQKGERTTAFRYSGSPHKNPVFKDLGEYSQKILTFYLKPVEHDRPLRVEFLSNHHSFSQIADSISALSAINPSYAYPAVLIEADLRAALEPNEVESQIQTLVSKVGGKNPILKLRRNSRPFR